MRDTSFHDAHFVQVIVLPRYRNSLGIFAIGATVMPVHLYDTTSAVDSPTASDVHKDFDQKDKDLIYKDINWDQQVDNSDNQCRIYTVAAKITCSG